MANQSGRNVSLIGSYQLRKLVGFGPISRLYLAQRGAGSAEFFALKVIETAPRIFRQEHRHLFFTQEVDRFMHLTHRSLLPLLDAGIHDGYPYLVYPYVRAGSLADYLAQRQTPLSPDESLVLIYQLGKALETAHQEGIVHGNIKPENIFLLMKGAETPAEIQLTRSVAALADFTIDSLTRGMRTARLQSITSARYMAPEQFWGAMNEWSDQYSLACLAYELLVGRPAFAGRDFHSLEKAHAQQQPLPPTQFVPALPHGIEEALLKALSKRVGDRYPDMQTFLAALTIPSLASDMIPTRPSLPTDAPATRPLIPITGKLILPLMPHEEESEVNAGGITQSVKVLPASQSTSRRKQLAQDRRWRWLSEQLKTFFYHVLVFCSLLIMWCGELWSIAVLLWRTLYNRGKLWREIQESSMRLPAVHLPAQPTRWLTTLAAAWRQGIARNRRRWRTWANPARPARKKSRRLTLLIITSLLGVSLCLSGAFLSLTVVNHRSGLRPGGIQIAPDDLTSMRTTAEPTAYPFTPSIAHQRPATPTPRPTPTPKPTPTPVPFSCQIHYRVVAQWSGSFEVTFTIRNSSTTPVHGWTLRFSFTVGQRITEGWNGHFSQHGTQVTISAQAYNSSIPAGGTLSTAPGFIGRWSGSNPAPASFTLNNTVCQNI